MKADSTIGSGSYIRAVTDFIFISHAPAPADVIFVPGSPCTEHVSKAAALYHAGFAPWVLPSGLYSIGSNAFTHAPGFDSEWAWMHSQLLEQGVPEHAILRENHATYTWENAQLSRTVTDRFGIDVQRGILCCQPCHARRALLYYQAAYPQTEWFVCPADPGPDVFGQPIPTRGTWHLTKEGRNRVLGEVRRLGSQVNEVFEMLLQAEQEET